MLLYAVDAQGRAALLPRARWARLAAKTGEADPILRFDDGMQFNTDGDYRIERRHDGLYVVGHGTLCPVDDYEEGRTMIREFEQRRTASE